MNVDRKIIEMIKHVTPEERNSLIKMLELKKHSGEMKLILAIFRDAYMFREMTYATILQYKEEISYLKHRINVLEKAHIEVKNNDKNNVAP